MNDAPARRSGPPRDTEAREEGRQLGAEIAASGLSIAEVARLAGLTTPSQYNTATAALKGRTTARPTVRKLRSAFARLTAEPAQS